MSEEQEKKPLEITDEIRKEYTELRGFVKNLAPADQQAMMSVYGSLSQMFDVLMATGMGRDEIVEFVVSVYDAIEKDVEYLAKIRSVEQPAITLIDMVTRQIKLRPYARLIHEEELAESVEKKRIQLSGG